MAGYWGSWSTTSLGILFVALSITLIFFFIRRLYVSPLYIAQHLDRVRPDLEESTTLLLENPATLSPLETLQRKKVQDILLNDPIPNLYSYQKIYRAAVFLLVVCCTSIVLFRWFPPTGSGQLAVKQTSPSYLQEVHSLSQTTKPRLEDLSIQIHPPSYTGIPSRNQSSGELMVPENSEIEWMVTANKNDLELLIVMSEKDTLRSTSNGKEVYHSKYRAAQSQVYQFLLVSSTGESYESDYFSLEVIPDTPPQITIHTPAPQTVLDPYNIQPLLVTADLTDNYGLGASRMIATLTKGSGEGIKFRQDTLGFDITTRTSKGQHTVTKTIAPNQLGMAPGDELYFHLEAYDNHQPTPLVTRSDTYFIILPDTTRNRPAFLDGLPVDNLPAYFRSQRQIIIDTEKLIEEKQTLTRKEFNSRSNNLGLDQKLLRLRYGEFLGEELESGVAISVDPDAIDEISDHSDEEHNHESEDHQHEEHAHNEHDHAHNEAEMTPPDAETSPTAAFTHFHDYEENATLFSVSIRSVLRAALSEMWEAELHLRMNRPEQALPYEYQALELLKDVQQRSRIYIKRIGFEPPPLKPADMRFSGELDAILSVQTNQDLENEPHHAALKDAIELLNALEQDRNIYSEQHRVTLQVAGQTLAAFSLSFPGKHLEALSRLRAIINAFDQQVSPSQEDVLHVKRTFWQLLPPAPRTPSKPRQHKELLHSYFKYLGDG